MLLTFNIQKSLFILEGNTKLTYNEKYVRFMDVLKDWYYKEMRIIGLIEVVDF